VRGVGVASIATFVALMGHVAGGGALPGWLGLLAPFALASAVSTVAVGRKQSLLGLSIAVVTSQALFHMLFTLGAPALPTAALAPHHHGASPTLPLDMGIGEHLHGMPAMTLMHAVAALLTIAALRWSERAVAAAAHGIAAVVRWLERVVAPVAIRPQRSLRPAQKAHGVIWHPTSLSIAASISRRGPPLSLSI